LAGVHSVLCLVLVTRLRFVSELRGFLCHVIHHGTCDWVNVAYMGQKPVALVVKAKLVALPQLSAKASKKQTRDFVTGINWVQE